MKKLTRLLVMGMFIIAQQSVIAQDNTQQEFDECIKLCQESREEADKCCVDCPDEDENCCKECMADAYRACDACMPKPCIRCYDNPLIRDSRPACFEEEKDKPVYTRVTRRARNYDFHQTLRKIQEPSTVTSFLTHTENSLGLDKKNFVLDADVRIPFTMGGKRFGLSSIHILPAFKVRIFQDDNFENESVRYGDIYGVNGDSSLAVRTPSTIPGFAYFFSFDRFWSTDYEKPNAYAGIIGYHSSNGQDGPEFYPTDSSVNIYNGNFGEQWVWEFAYGQHWRLAGKGDVFDRRRNRSRVNNHESGKRIFLKTENSAEFFWRMSLEYHIKSWSGPGWRELEQYGYGPNDHMYGRLRLNAQSGLILFPMLWEFIGNNKKQWCSVMPERNYERWRFTWNVNYILDSNYYRGSKVSELQKVKFLELRRRLNYWVTAYWVLGRTKYSAVFLQAGYYGSDNYNIYFNDSLWHFKAGLAFGVFDQPDEPDQLR